MPVRNQPTVLTAKVGARIRELRLQRNMSLADVKVAVGVTPGHLSGVEHGRVNVTLECLGRIAKALGVEICELVSFTV
ncbi:MAG: helix-turn-helix transcriptional regulator [Polyangiaceae bacterium]|nr:helix-turn-helix transcriptional regulator [Polyangiaceae bacterium]